MDIFDMEIAAIDGAPRRMADFRGKVLLVVNVASRCGFTPQYRGLEELHRRFAGNGFAVLGFPCDQFGHQEPGTEQEIAEFCSANFDVSFPMFGKIDVNGARAHPFYVYLKSSAPGVLGTQSIKWNFTKFLVDAQGKVVHRYAPTVVPEDIAGDIQSQLAL